jgi:hypothetical protein
MSYKRISIRFNLDIEDERNAWELLHSSSCGPINKEVIDSINTAHKLSTLEALLRKVISEELRNISLHIPFEIRILHLMRTKVASWISSKASNGINLEPISAILIHRGINLEPHEQGYFLRSVR